MKTLLRLATGPASCSGLLGDPTADPVPIGERLIGLAVVAFLVLAMFA